MERVEDLVRIMVVSIAMLLVFGGVVGYAMDQKELPLFVVAGVGFMLTIVWALPSSVGHEGGDRGIRIMCLALLVVSVVFLGIVHF